MTEGRLTESSSRICQLLMIHMTGGGPFGFRIASVHSDGISPFAVSTIRINGKAYRAGLLEADLVLAINGFSCCSGLSHHSATKLMEYDDPELTLHILRGENLCEDDIKKSLQSLDSQIVELTDNEVQSTIAKKQLQQPVGIPAWKTKVTNSLSHLNVSPSWLQPPPNTRPKAVERRNDMLSLSQPIEHTLTDSAGLTDDQVHETWTRVKTKANNDMTASLTMDQLKMSETNESSKDLQLNDKSISELKNNNLDCASSQKYQLNDAKQQSRWIDLPSNVSMDKANDKFISQSKSTAGHFDMASYTNISDRFIDNKVEEAGQNILLKQQQNNSHFRNRYRVEQTILFKPLDQARIYDAESGQFRENSSEKLPKRRSNSISCYHMYIGSGIPKPSSVVECNTEHFHQADECSQWKPSEGNRKQFDGTVYQWANGAIKNPVTDLNQGVSKSSSTSMQLPRASSPNVTDICMSSSVKLSQQLYPTETLSNNVDSNTSHWSSNGTIQSATTPTEQLQASPNRWETRRLQQSPSVHSFSPAVDDVSLRGSNSPHCMPMSMAKLAPATMGTVFYETPSKSILGTSKALPTMISLRSNEDEASSPVCTHLSLVNETALAKARPSKHYSDMKSLNFDAPMHGSSKSRVTSTFGFDTNQQLTQPEDHYSAHKPNRSINQTWPVNANSNSLNTFLVNEGKGGRLFARRRANSDAWIVGERDEPNKTGAKSTINDSNHLARIHAISKPPDVMQRRQSLTVGHLQQPVHSEIGNNSHQYRSRTAQKVMNSLSSSRPFDEMQYTNRPNCHSQSSAGQRGINQSVQHQLDLNSWQQRGTTDHPISPSQRFRPPQADQHPNYLHAAEANRLTVQSNTGYTDL